MDARGVDRTQPYFKLARRPPITWVGRCLRALSLDELPQLWNVVRGDMSLVGPRPPARRAGRGEPGAPWSTARGARGSPGWWQISGRSDVGPEEAIKLDLFYIENWSLSLDMYILLKTRGPAVRKVP